MAVRWLMTILVASTALLLPTSPATADIARLKNGGEVRGRFVGIRDPKRPLEIETHLGGRIVFEPGDVLSTARRSPDVEEYVTRSRSIPHTVEAHWQLAEWCKVRQLATQREEQLEAILELEPSHAGAHRGLDHIVYQDQWMTRDDAMREQGYVKYKGKYLSQQEIDLLEKTSSQRQAEQSWYPKVRLWKTWATGSHTGRQVDALVQLRGITDEDAVPALRSFLSDTPEIALRQLYVERLTSMRGVKPVASLVRTSLLDIDSDLRQAAFGGLRSDQREAAIPYYVEALRDKENKIVNRAAAALGVIGDFKVVPALIRALVTSHKVTYEAPVQNDVTFSRPQGGRYSVGAPTGGMLPPNIEILLRTGQLPYGVAFDNPTVKTQPVTVQANLRNEEVLASLRKITAQDFGYDEDAWQTYWDAYRSGKGKL